MPNFGSRMAYGFRASIVKRMKLERHLKQETKTEGAQFASTQLNGIPHVILPGSCIILHHVISRANLSDLTDTSQDEGRDPWNPPRLSVALVYFVNLGEGPSRLLALLGAQFPTKLLLPFYNLLIDSRLDV